jgi:hypothetical protein
VASFEELVEAARRLVEQPLSFSLESFLRVVEDYVNSLPESLKESYLGVMAGPYRKVVKRKDLPKVLREDPEFRERFIRFLAGE